jgi:hypothetical protein
VQVQGICATGEDAAHCRNCLIQSQKGGGAAACVRCGPDADSVAMYGSWSQGILGCCCTRGAVQNSCVDTHALCPQLVPCLPRSVICICICICICMCICICPSAPHPLTRPSIQCKLPVAGGVGVGGLNRHLHCPCCQQLSCIQPCQPLPLLSILVHCCQNRVAWVQSLVWEGSRGEHGGSRGIGRGVCGVTRECCGSRYI